MLRRTSSPYVNDITKGKSFNFSVWDDLTAYNNNALIQDFVTYAGAMYVCLNSVQAGDVDPKTDTVDGTIVGNYWMQVVKGIEGPKGDDGKIYVPTVSSAGTLSWKVNSGVVPKSINIKGQQGESGLGLEFKWSGTKLLVRQEGSADWTASPDLKSTLVYTPSLKNGNLVFEPTNQNDYQPINFGKIKGENGKDGLSAYEIAVKKGFKGTESEWVRSLAKQVGSLPMRNILLRVDTDPALFPDENYCGTHIQWKYDSDDYPEWNNLIQINQLMNIALSGLNLNYDGVEEHDGKECYHLSLNYNEIDYIDAKNNVKFGPKIRTISDVYLPIMSSNYVSPDKIAEVDKTDLYVSGEGSCENYFYISDPNNKGWTLTSHCSGSGCMCNCGCGTEKKYWVTATPGGADTAFNYQEGLDSILTPCETSEIDSVISGTGSTLVMVCVDENTTSSSRSCSLIFTASGTTTKINIHQEKGV